MRVAVVAADVCAAVVPAAVSPDVDDEVNPADGEFFSVAVL